MSVTDIAERTWKKALTYSKEGALSKDAGNLLLYLVNDSRWRGCLAYDEFADRVFWAKGPPSIDTLDAASFPVPIAGTDASDRDSVYVHHWFAKMLGVSMSAESVTRGIEAAAHSNVICPPRDYLRALKWDGVARLATMFLVYFGGEQSVYTESVGRWWMISAVARMFEPGCKADCILILQGKQGAKKSSALAVLGDKWYSNSLPDVTSKDAQLSLAGSWIIEIPELEAMNRSATTAFKDFSARTFDKFRKPYSRFQVTQQRTCVFAGTTNEEKLFNDPTGARRFWTVRVALGDKLIDLAALKRDRDQLWAEAVHLFDMGEQWWPSSDLQDTMQAEQDDRYVDDVWTAQIATWCDKQESVGVESFMSSEILMLAIGLELPKQDVTSSVRVGKIMKRLGYEQTGRRLVGGRKLSVYGAKNARLELESEDYGDV